MACGMFFENREEEAYLMPPENAIGWGATHARAPQSAKHSQKEAWSTIVHARASVAKGEVSDRPLPPASRSHPQKYKIKNEVSDLVRLKSWLEAAGQIHDTMKEDSSRCRSDPMLLRSWRSVEETALGLDTLPAQQTHLMLSSHHTTETT